jgi:uncharacterized membrane protein
LKKCTRIKKKAKGTGGKGKVKLHNIEKQSKGKQVVDSFYFTYVYSILLFNILIINGVCLVAATMNGVYELEGMIDLINNVVLVFTIVWMS